MAHGQGGEWAHRIGIGHGGWNGRGWNAGYPQGYGNVSRLGPNKNNVLEYGSVCLRSVIIALTCVVRVPL